MQLHCPNCQHNIEEDNINVVKTIAVCKSCNNLFDFTNELKHATLPVPHHEVVHVPSGVDLTEYRDSLEITLDWRRSSSSFLFMFSLFWNGFMVVWCSIALMNGAWPMLLFSIPFIAVGVWLLYSSVGYMFNTTTFFVDEHFLAVEHRPINFLAQRDKYYTPEEVDQLYVKRHSPGESNGRKVYAYEVHLKLKNGKDVNLIKNLKSEDAAWFIEQRIEQYMGIENRKMPDEWR